ncbi:hypothetical protein R6Q59_022455 [Mikania micrantha]
MITFNDEVQTQFRRDELGNQEINHSHNLGQVRVFLGSRGGGQPSLMISSSTAMENETEACFVSNISREDIHLREIRNVRKNCRREYAHLREIRNVRKNCPIE